MRYLYIWIV